MCLGDRRVSAGFVVDKARIPCAQALERLLCGYHSDAILGSGYVVPEWNPLIIHGQVSREVSGAAECGWYRQDECHRSFAQFL